ncbi:MAG: hypothetical protein K8R79_02150 [Calditrichales bacterium]|nr:hypothetical protein [Calditrichales bacterium]
MKVKFKYIHVVKHQIRLEIRYTKGYFYKANIQTKGVFINGNIGLKRNYYKASLFKRRSFAVLPPVINLSAF